ncbi:MAG: S8 family serine peptidase [Gemmataceae bacterium]|nr:S8 family serine peptidase [Gemmataceae bacterium]
MRARLTDRCPLCGTPSPVARLAAATWLAPPVVDEVRSRYAAWDPANGACPNCARLQLQRILTEQALTPPKETPDGHHKLPAWECLPTPFRVGADPRFTGAGVTIAMIDAAFYPHPDLVRPRNRIRAWIDATGARIKAISFAPDEKPHWPGWDNIDAAQWHGLMASGIAAGNGRLSHGLYRGIAPDAELILVQTMDSKRKITNATLAKALRWLHRYGASFGLKVINFSVAGDPVDHLPGNVVDRECERLLKKGITLVAACGNSNRHFLVPPATSPAVIAVGGLDDRDRIDPEAWRPWHSNWGEATDGSLKPDLVAPSWRVVAPLLPQSSVAAEAKELFARRLLGDRTCEPRINAEKLVTPYYQHMDGTSVSAPIVSSAVACMLQANPGLTPARVKELLLKTCKSVPSIPAARQGAGAVQAGAAVAAALAARFESIGGRRKG